ncbi:MAG: hypothetical protein ACKO4U_17945 [Caldilinea sp.]
MHKQRVTLVLDADVADMLDKLAGSPHKKSAYVSALLRAANAALTADDPVTLLDRRLVQIERQLALLFARLD